MISATTESWGVGPINLDVAMARRHGWSEQAIRNVATTLGTISRREAEASHWSGPVRNCPCVTCDFSIKTKDLPEPGEHITRARWERFKNAGGVVNGAAV